MQFDVITLFPEMITNCFESTGVVSNAIKKNKIILNTINPRQFAEDNHQSVDDRPYGGGPGMLMSCDVIDKSLQDVVSSKGRGYRVFLSPQGKKLDHQMVEKLSNKSHLVLLCGRYEGVDQRVVDKSFDLEVSIGDFVLSGGELAAAILIDSISRLKDGVLGHKDSCQHDSFFNGLLDCPHYTRPETYRGEKVPNVLLSGHHEQIAQYRHQQSLGSSWIKRPDLFAKKALSEEELCLLNDFLKQYRN